MQRRRVGTLSMGVVLIASGVLLVLFRISGKAAVDAFLTWWPLTLVLLGGEVLWAAAAPKDQAPKVIYDLFSLFIVGMIVTASLGLYALTEVGIIPRLREEVLAQQFTLRLPAQAIAVPAGINRIVVEAPACPLSVRTGAAGTVTVDGTARVSAATAADARGMLADLGAVQRRDGSTLYLAFDQPAGGGPGYRAGIDNFSLTVPGDIALEVVGGSRLQLYADGVRSDWLIDGAGQAEARLPAAADLHVTAAVTHPEGPGGDAPWQKAAPVAGGGTAETLPAGGVPQRSEFTLGGGKHHLDFLNCGWVTVNMLQ